MVDRFRLTLLNNTYRGESFQREWVDAIDTSKHILEDNDLDMIGESGSWNDVENIISRSGLSSIKRMLFSLDELKTFVGFFETELGVNLDASFFRGTLTRLLQVSHSTSIYWSFKKIIQNKYADILYSL